MEPIYVDISPFLSNLQIEDRYGAAVGRIDYVPVSVLQNAPRADVAPVIHAHWERTGWQKRGVEFEYRCSHCKRCKIWKKRTQKLPYYCEKCGSKMDDEIKR